MSSSGGPKDNLSVLKMKHQRSWEFQLGVLGAGRLGEALAKVWLNRTAELPLVWSRRGQVLSDNEEPRIPDAVWVTEWTEVLQAQSVVVAIPGRSLVELAERNDQARSFEGFVFSAAASLSQESLQRVFPKATVILVAPFLIDGANSMPMLVLRPSHLPDSQWETAKAQLEAFGDIDVVQDENLFAQLSLLGAPWPVVILAAIQAACRTGIDGLQDEKAIGIGRRVFFRAMQTLLSSSASERSEKVAPGNHVATPGGITERGLDHVGELASLFECAFAGMQTRAKELRT
jgi:pyrroline-5-carboxylate reductase